LLAAKKLGGKAEEYLVFEDAPAGIAAEASDAQVMVITAAHQHAFKTNHTALASHDTHDAERGLLRLRSR
jgi:sugar-phosphatase